MELSGTTIRRVDEMVAAAQAIGRAPSLVAAVIRDGEVVHVSGAGQTPPPSRDTQYRIGSITKTMTAAAVLGLRDEGRLSLDDPIGQYVSGLPPAAGRRRLRELLSHTAGLQAEPEGLWWESHADVSIADLVGALTESKVVFAPYERHHYSNLAFGLLGAAVVSVTGVSWWQAVRDRLLDPLGLRRTTYQAVEPFARGYVVHPWYQTLHEQPRHDHGAMAPAGQLWSTVDDLAKWAAFLASPAGPAAEMAAPVVIYDSDRWTGGYGLGLNLWRQGERVFAGHVGSMPGYLAVVAVHRPSGTGAVALANSYTLNGMDIGDLGCALVAAVLDGEPEPAPAAWRPAPEPPAEVVELCGHWWWMGIGFEASWDAVRGELVLASLRPPRETWKFVRDGGRWRGRDGSIAGEFLTPLRDETGAVTALDIATYVLTRSP